MGKMALKLIIPSYKRIHRLVAPQLLGNAGVMFMPMSCTLSGICFELFERFEQQVTWIRGSQYLHFQGLFRSLAPHDVTQSGDQRVILFGYNERAIIVLIVVQSIFQRPAKENAR
jgi:hypothetical protein